jgi:methylated-DNA-[protein]-cysteine S-methyltransferase
MKKLEGKIGKGNEKAPVFFQEAYKAASQIPKGRVATYGDIAVALGISGGARAVGRAMALNHDTRTVPCHRVIRGDGHVGGYAKGFLAKIAILQKEGVTIDSYRRKVKDFETVRFKKFKKK